MFAIPSEVADCKNADRSRLIARMKLYMELSEFKLLTPEEIAFVTFLAQRMEELGCLNKVYVRWLGQQNIVL